MSITCPACQSSSIIRKGKVLQSGEIVQRYKCKICPSPINNFYTAINDDNIINNEPAIESTNKNRTWVVTTAVNDVPVNEKFLNTLKSYCEYNNAELLIGAIKYNQGLNEDGYSWDESVIPYLVNTNITLTNGLKYLAGVPVSPAIGNPLSGFESFSKGDSIILSHPQLMMKTIALSHVDHAAIITTTGCVTEPVYTTTKQGSKAQFNHSYSALVIEEDSEIDSFHIRVLNSDESGIFYDIDKKYDNDKVTKNTNIPAIVLGDEHVAFICPNVMKTTFSNTDSIINTLAPKKIIRHDIYDGYSASHHHTKNIFTQYAKHISGKNDVAKELALTIEHILKTTPDYAESIVVSSNHNEHLTKWLNEANPKLDHTNAILYHELMYLMLKQTKLGRSGAEYPNPLELWAENNYDFDNIKFVGGFDSFKVHDIECVFHSHKGTNGSRGSIEQFSKLGTKTIIGHSHSPGIFGGCWQVGHSCESKLEYNYGSPSSWAKAHCLIQPNGKRQMIFIKEYKTIAKWRR